MRKRSKYQYALVVVMMWSLVIAGLGVAAVLDSKDDSPRACSTYSNTPVKNVPARCLSYYQEK